MDTWMQILLAVVFLAGIAGAGWWLWQSDWTKAKEHHQHQLVQVGAPEVTGGGYWYVDPVNPQIERWWNGTQPTDGWRWRTATPSTASDAGQVIHVIVAWTVTVFTLGYMLPWAVAASREMPNAGAIALLNALTGWTGIGWIIALVMACGQRR